MDKSIKLKQIYLPFLFVSVSSILFYNTIRWFLDIKLDILHINEDLLDIWIPLVFSFFTVYFFLGKRLRILAVKNIRSYYALLEILSFAIAVPIFLSQNYIEKASFDLITVNTIEKYTNIIMRNTLL